MGLGFEPKLSLGQYLIVFFCIMTVSKNCYLTQMETLKLVLSIVSEYQGCHTDGLSVSVFGGLIIYIQILAALNVKKNGLFDISFV